jgi:deoxyribodipyrimidine photolyase
VCSYKRRIAEDRVATKEIQEERIRQLNDKYIREGNYVLYWMQEAQRAEYNHALEYAVQRANELGQRLLAVFGLTDGYPEANLRHYVFLLEGLQDVRKALRERKIKFVARRGSPGEVALEVGKNASLIVCDMSYLRLQKEWREKVAEEAGCLVVQVETEVVVPVELASNKQEHAAAPQPAPNRRRLAHEQVPALRSRLSHLRCVEDPRSESSARRPRFAPGRAHSAPRTLDIISNLQSTES